MPNAHIFWAMVSENFSMLVIGPADLFLSPLLAGHAPFGRTFAALLFLALRYGE